MKRLGILLMTALGLALGATAQPSDSPAVKPVTQPQSLQSSKMPNRPTWRTPTYTLVARDMDLRTANRAARGEFVDRSPLGDGVMLLSHPLGSYMDIYCYQKPLDFGKALKEFARKDVYPVYVHCAGGADRTGTLCFLLETLCGVSVADATIDYELTSFSPVGQRTRNRESVQPFALVVRTMDTFPGETFADKVAYWAEKVAGLTKAEIAAIRDNLMHGL